LQASGEELQENRKSENLYSSNERVESLIRSPDVLERNDDGVRPNDNHNADFTTDVRILRKRKKTTWKLTMHRNSPATALTVHDVPTSAEPSQSPHVYQDQRDSKRYARESSKVGYANYAYVSEEHEHGHIHVESPQRTPSRIKGDVTANIRIVKKS
jgi:hypothetical protein